MAELLLPSLAGSPAQAPLRNPELKAEVLVPKADEGNSAEHSSCSTPGSEEAGLGLSLPAMQYLIRVGERRRRLVMDIIRIVIRPWEQRSWRRRERRINCYCSY